MIIIGGVVAMPRTRQAMPDKPPASFVDPAGVVQTAWSLVHQDLRVWSFEAEARPYGEAR